MGSHPTVTEVRLIGSRAESRATAFSDWDFQVATDDFPSVRDALPRLLEPLEPLVQQWDRLSRRHCWMLIVPGPAKVDLLFPGEPHELEPPWEASAGNLEAIDAHFWDWMLWLKAKEAAGKADLVARELAKLFDHLLGPLGVEAPPTSLHEALAVYRRARERAERSFGASVRRELEAAVAPALGR